MALIKALDLSVFLVCVNKMCCDNYMLSGDFPISPVLGFGAFTAGAQVQSLVGELRSCQLHMKWPKPFFLKYMLLCN